MKFDLLQDDFSAGEISPRTVGRITADVFKAGMARLANVMTTKSGSFASRAGGRLISDGDNGIMGPGRNQGQVQHLPVSDGPSGDFIVEVGPTNIRLMDRFGPIPMTGIPNQDMQYSYQQVNAWADADSRTVYLSTGGTYLLREPAITDNPVGLPFGTDESFDLSGNLAGNDVTLRITSTIGGGIQDFVLTAGPFSVNFVPVASLGQAPFRVELISTGAPRASKLWGIRCIKNFNDVTLAHGLQNPTAGVDRVRAAGCWINMNLTSAGPGPTPESMAYWIIFAGGTNNVMAGYALRMLPSFGSPITQWTFIALPLAPGSAAAIAGANAVAIYQERIWFGRTLPGQRPQLVASKIGYIEAYDSNYMNPSPAFVFTPVTYSYTFVGTGLSAFNTEIVKFPAINGFPTVFFDGVRFPLPGKNPPYPNNPGTVGAGIAPNISVYRNGVAVPNVAGPLYTLGAAPPASGTVVTESPQYFFGASLSGLGGVAWFRWQFLNPGDVITFATIPLATDPLNLSLSSPTAKVAWLNVLRGLLMGTTQTEALFAQGQTLAIDPATGQVLSRNDESYIGSDEHLMAVNVNDKVLFAQRGRQVIKMAALNFFTSGGLVAEDVGVLGEHLLKARIQSMAYLKTPVPRVVFGFDDGTGAVMTIMKSGVAWARFTLPAIFGGIYSVASLESTRGSELWIGTCNGITLQWDNFESDISTTIKPVAGAFPAAPVFTPVDTANPLPPVMDGWVRAPVVDVGGVQSVTDLSLSMVFQDVWVLVNGQPYGPYNAIVDSVRFGGGVVAKVVLPAGLVTTTWMDGSGTLQAQDVYVGKAYPEHKAITLPLEGGNPVGTSQGHMSRKVQLYVRLVDSYAPLVGMDRPPERGSADPTDMLGRRITGDVRVTQLGFNRGAQLTIQQDLPLRMEISAIFGGAQVNGV